eukprot:c7412_g1_i1.p1 GENE.c7412_g1_i1~~c7412_g1_i1.p1  ORF type:complete len:190 (+),score=25.26 c7412_g1_i1:3-572(+)
MGARIDSDPKLLTLPPHLAATAAVLDTIKVQLPPLTRPASTSVKSARPSFSNILTPENKRLSTTEKWWFKYLKDLNLDLYTDPFLVKINAGWSEHTVILAWNKLKMVRSKTDAQVEINLNRGTLKEGEKPNEFSFTPAGHGCTYSFRARNEAMARSWFNAIKEHAKCYVIERPDKASAPSNNRRSLWRL